jgi:glycosyltransferase involved in cell wall biosynthesis
MRAKPRLPAMSPVGFAAETGCKQGPGPQYTTGLSRVGRVGRRERTALQERDPRASAAASASRLERLPRPTLIFLVTEDWYFWSHRLPIARAARDAGFGVLVATRVRDHASRIEGEGFRLAALPWRRRGDGPVGAVRAIGAIAALYRRERPDIVHHVALKPVLFGGLAVRLAFPGSRARPEVVSAVAGLGSGLGSPSGKGGWVRPVLGWALRQAAGAGRVIVQNPEDGETLAGFGIDPARLVLIRGSGVDTAHFAPLPEPAGPVVRVALVARMLRSKGVLEAAEAVRRLRARRLPVELVLAGPIDPDNNDSLDDGAMQALAAEPGIEWLGRVEDVREVWRRAAIAVLPSTYGEGLPKALLEAAACGRPIVATDMPGCREIVRPGETGLLVPPHDVAALTQALATLAADAERRQTMGRAARLLAERDFDEQRVASQTVALYRAALAERDAPR